MRKRVALAVLMIATSLPSVASAQVFLGARLGYGIPYGDIMKDWALDESVRSQIPVTVDLGLRLGRALAVGAYASYGFVQPSKGWQDDCDAANSTCSAYDLRIGVQANLHASNTETTEFWGGIAFGYEEARFKDSKGLISDLSFKGYDATLQGGFDFLASSSFRIGPFASATVGQFNKAKSTSESDITDKGLHGFFQLGVRGFYSL